MLNTSTDEISNVLKQHYEDRLQSLYEFIYRDLPQKLLDEVEDQECLSERLQKLIVDDGLLKQADNEILSLIDQVAYYHLQNEQLNHQLMSQKMSFQKDFDSITSKLLRIEENQKQSSVDKQSKQIEKKIQDKKFKDSFSNNSERECEDKENTSMNQQKKEKKIKHQRLQSNYNKVLEEKNELFIKLEQMDIEKRQLEYQTIKLQQQVQDINLKNINYYIQENEDYKYQIQELQLEIQNKYQIITQLEKEKLLYFDEIQVYKQKIQKETDENQIKSLRILQDKHQEQINEIIKETELKNEKIKNLDKENQNKLVNLENFHQEQLEDQKKNYIKQIQELKKQIDILTTQAQKINQERHLDNLNSQQSKDQLETLKNQQNQSKIKIMELQNQITQLGNEKKEQINLNQNLKIQLAEKTQKLDEIEQRLSQTEERLNQIVEEQKLLEEEKDGQINQLIAELESKELEIEKLSSSIRELNTESKKYQIELENKNVQLDFVQNELQEESLNLKQENLLLQTQIEEICEKSQIFQNEFNENKRQHFLEIENLQKQLNHLQEQQQFTQLIGIEQENTIKTLQNFINEKLSDFMKKKNQQINLIKSEIKRVLEDFKKLQETYYNHIVLINEAVENQQRQEEIKIKRTEEDNEEKNLEIEIMIKKIHDLEQLSKEQREEFDLKQKEFNLTLENKEKSYQQMVTFYNQKISFFENQFKLMQRKDNTVLPRENETINAMTKKYEFVECKNEDVQQKVDISFQVTQKNQQDIQFKKSKEELSLLPISNTLVQERKPYFHEENQKNSSNEIYPQFQASQNCSQIRNSDQISINTQRSKVINWKILQAKREIEIIQEQRRLNYQFLNQQ